MIHHVCMNIDGAIRNAKDLRGCIKADGCTLNTLAEVREWLNKQKAKGYRVLPMGCCKGFDFQTGCPGHDSDEEVKKHEAVTKIACAICEEEETCTLWCGVATECKAYQEAKKIYEERKSK